MTDCDPSVVGLVVARQLAAAQAVVEGAGLPRTMVGVAPSPTVPHITVAVADTEARHTLARLAATNGWLVLLAPASAYRRAATLLILATRLPMARRMLHVNELLVYQLLAATTDEEQDALVNAVLGPVIDLPTALGSRLLTTLEALHWNEGSAKATARALGLHSKTVLNRLRRFEAVTGLCLDRPPDRLRTDIALYLLRMRGRLARIEIDRASASLALCNSS